MVTWCDIIIDLNQNFGVVCTEIAKDIWLFEKSSEDLESTASFHTSEDITEGIFFTICDELRIPKPFFISKYNLNHHHPIPQPIEE